MNLKKKIHEFYLRPKIIALFSAHRPGEILLRCYPAAKKKIFFICCFNHLQQWYTTLRVVYLRIFHVLKYEFSMFFVRQLSKNIFFRPPAWDLFSSPDAAETKLYFFGLMRKLSLKMPLITRSEIKRKRLKPTIRPQEKRI